MSALGKRQQASDYDDPIEAEQLHCTVCGSSRVRNGADYFQCLADIGGINAYARLLAQCCSPTCLYTACVLTLPRTRTDILDKIRERLERQYGEGTCVIVRNK